ncbi:EKC/KEOPS complex subunit TPRKB-like isoform X2 [Artemia franciscana]|uniref:EKC/KEOPS complex subunit TPRKB-like isoform X2 n=1 Tax=Artemia franciscana TaxID=6661 RepID=UPI0032DA0BC9
MTRKNYMEDSVQLVLAANTGAGLSTSEIRNLILDSSLKCSLISPKLVLDEFHIKHAVALALKNRSNLQLKTKSIYTEILYCLSPDRKIGNALKTLGLSDNAEYVLIATVDDPTGEHLKKSIEIIKWEIIDITSLPLHSDVKLITKYYKVKPNELTVGSLREAVVNRMSCKELFNF